MDKTVRRAQAFLLDAQNEDGGWSYSLGGQSYPEPTSYSLLALSCTGSSCAVAGDTTFASQGLQWITTHLNPQGALVLDNDDEPHWGTSLVAFVLATLDKHKSLKARCVQGLLDWMSSPLEPDPIAPMDTRLIGWPWIGETFSWVEPTSYAVLALKRAGYGDHPRVTEAVRLLLDRACVGGGWNYGNPIVFDQDLDAFMPTTAMALFALQNVVDAKDAIARGIAFLREEASQYHSSLSLALTILCLDLFNQPVDPFVTLLLERQQPDGSWRHMVHLTALSVLALQSAGGEGNVFKI